MRVLIEDALANFADESLALICFNRLKTIRLEGRDYLPRLHHAERNIAVAFFIED